MKQTSTNAFTLVELLVTMTILSLLLLLLVQMVDLVSIVWSSTSGKISAFQESRASFETFTRKVSQATLNTYWDYEYPNDNMSLPPTNYVRQSELHFVSGTGNALLQGLPAHTTSHALFFQAPLGYSTGGGSQDGDLVNLLNASGFFIHYGSDQERRPRFLRNVLAERNRYRLMEVWQPTEQLQVYRYPQQELKASASKRTEWFTGPLQDLTAARPLAENIIALVLWPKRSAADVGEPLSKDYTYDTRGYMQANSAISRLTRNQLPPVMHVTMVALDEPSAARLEQRYGNTAELLQPGRLFTSADDDPASEERIMEDLRELEDFLISERLNYRIFSTNVTIRQAKWSEN